MNLTLHGLGSSTTLTMCWTLKTSYPGYHRPVTHEEKGKAWAAVLHLGNHSPIVSSSTSQTSTVHIPLARCNSCRKAYPTTSLLPPPPICPSLQGSNRTSPLTLKLGHPCISVSLLLTVKPLTCFFVCLPSGMESRLCDVVVQYCGVVGFHRVHRGALVGPRSVLMLRVHSCLCTWWLFAWFHVNLTHVAFGGRLITSLLPAFVWSALFSRMNTRLLSCCPWCDCERDLRLCVLLTDTMTAVCREAEENIAKQLSWLYSATYFENIRLRLSL